VTGGRDAVTEDRINVRARKSQQTRQWPISRLFPPLAEQVEDEKEWGGLGSCRRFQGEVVFDLLENTGTISPRCAEAAFNASLERPSACVSSWMIAVVSIALAPKGKRTNGGVPSVRPSSIGNRPTISATNDNGRLRVIDRRVIRRSHFPEIG